MRRLCVLLSIASLCLFGAAGARISQPEAAARAETATIPLAPAIGAAQLATVIPTHLLRDSVSAGFAVVVAVFVVTALMAIAQAMQRRRPVRQLLQNRTARTRGPPSRLRPLFFSL